MLLERNPNLKLSVSTTTRTPRGSEKHGIEYFFVTKEIFESEIQKGHFAEWAKVHDNYYGTSKKFIDESFSAGHSVLLDIDVQGAESLRKSYPKRNFSVFISPPSLEVLESRLRGRGTENEDLIQKRLRNAKSEMLHLDRFDLSLVNEDLDETYRQLETAVQRAITTGVTERG